MKRNVLRFSTIFLFCCFFMQSFSQSLIKEEKIINGKKKFSYVTDKGKTIIPYGKYHFAYSDTIDTIGFVLKNKNIVAINNKGKELFNVFIFDNGPDYPVNNIFRITNKNKMGLADMNGNIILNPKYNFIRPFSEGYAAYNIGGKTIKIPNSDYSEFVGGKWGFLDHSGKVVFPAIFDKVEDFQNRESLVQINSYKFRIRASN